MSWMYPPQTEVSPKDRTATDFGEVVRRNVELAKAEAVALRRRLEMAVRSGSLFNSMQVTWGQA